MTTSLSKPIYLFYILVFYVLFQFSWWAYLLVNLNTEVCRQKIEFVTATHSSPAELQFETAKYEKELHKRWMMVAGEGIVFLSLLLFGIQKTKNAFKREFALAKQQKNFLLSITHEFKSPLAAVKLNLQTLQKRKLEPEQKDHVIRKALLETERIHLLIENALIASRLESHNYEYYFEPIDLSHFLKDAVNEFIDRQDHEHIISHNIELGIAISGDKMALISLIYNLLENAEKYSPADTEIKVSLKKENAKEAVLRISDEGNGIPESERQKVFEKFYRMGNEDTRKTKGTGLGLFIVQHVVTLHKGSIQVKSNQPSGAIFEIRLPIS